VHRSLDQQVDALTAEGVYAAHGSTSSPIREQHPGSAALLDYARQGDAIVVVGIWANRFGN
jgi:hypothetical protein